MKKLSVKFIVHVYTLSQRFNPSHKISIGFIVRLTHQH